MISSHNSHSHKGVRKWISWLTVILLLVVLVYLPIFQNGFLVTWDDNRYILENPYIKSLGLQSAVKIFSIYYDGHYHPLTLISLAVDHSLSGLNPNGYHTTNLILHLLNTFLVFCFIFLLLKKRERFIPLITALLFGIATIQVESVAWASERKNLLFASFFLLSLITYLQFVNTNRWKYYFLALGLYVLSLMSKVMALPLCLTILLVDYYFERKLINKKLLLEKIPFFLVAIVFGYIAIIAQKSSWGDHLSQEHYPLYERILSSGYAFIGYFLKSIIPYGLSGFYPYPDEVNVLLAIRNVVLVLISVGLVVVAFYLRNKIKNVAFSILFFSVNIFFLLKIFNVPAGDYLMADRYAYISSIGIFMLIASGFHALLSKSTVLKKTGVSVLVVYVIFLSLFTFNRISVWRDDVNFYTDIISKYPDAEIAYTNRGAIRKENRQYAKALDDFNKAIQLGKNDYKAFANRGAAYSELGQYNKAATDYKKAVTLRPDNPDVLASYGFTQLQIGDFTGAIQTLTRSLALREFNPEAYTNRGTAKFSLGDFSGAIADYNLASAQDPAYVNPFFNSGLAYINLGNYESAIKSFNEAIRINPAHFESYSNMGIAWSKLGDFEQAFNCYDKAIELQPNYYEAWLNRGIDKFYQSDYEGSVFDLTKAIEINPNIAPAYYFRGMILLDSDADASCDDMKQAARLGFEAATFFLTKHCR